MWNESGVGRYIRNLTRYLQVVDKENEYVLFARSEDYREIRNQELKIKNNGWKIVATDIRWHSFEEQLRMPSILKREKLDLVHFPYHSIPVLYDRPFVVTIHDLIPYHFPTGKASTLLSPLYQLKLLGYRFVISQAVKKAKKIIAVSKATKQEIIDHLGVSPDKVVVTYEGVDEKISNLKSQI